MLRKKIDSLNKEERERRKNLENNNQLDRE